MTRAIVIRSIVVGIVIGLVGCGSVTPADVDGGELGGRGGAGGDIHRQTGGAGGAGGGAGAAVDAGCSGCWLGGTCVAIADQTDSVCGVGGAACKPSALSCSGVQGACPAGEQLAKQEVCNSAGVARSYCCPANACDYGCPPCQGCP